MSFGVKRQIFTSKNVEHVPFLIHTVLHEIREIIEADFCRLGFGTTNSSELDSLADQFSFAVHTYGAAVSLQDWVKDASQTNSMWQKVAFVSVFTIGAVLFGLCSLSGAFGYRFQSPSVKRSRLKRL
jgi:hypothetical protein